MNRINRIYTAGYFKGLKAARKNGYKILDLGAWNQQRLSLQREYKDLMRAFYSEFESEKNPRVPSFHVDLNTEQQAVVDKYSSAFSSFNEKLIYFLETSIELFRDAKLDAAADKILRKLERDFSGFTHQQVNPREALIRYTENPQNGFFGFSSTTYENLFYKLADVAVWLNNNFAV